MSYTQRIKLLLILLLTWCSAGPSAQAGSVPDGGLTTNPTLKVDISPVREVTLASLRQRPVINKRVALINQPIMGNMEPVTEFLKKAVKDEASSVDLIINSPGGSVQDGIVFISRMDWAKERGVNIRCFISGIAASMAFQILTHCNERYALSGAGILWHHVSATAGRTPITADLAHQLMVELAMLDTFIWADIERTVVTQGGMDVTEARYHMDHETLHVATQLRESSPGFLDGVFDSIEGLFEAIDNEATVKQEALGGFFLRQPGSSIVNPTTRPYN